MTLIKKRDNSDMLLFTPGPLTTSANVKKAALHDYGSRDANFIRVIADIRRQLLDIAGVDFIKYTTIPVQGSGTYGIEAVLTSLVDIDDHLLIIANGRYGERMQKIADIYNLSHDVLTFADNAVPDAAAVAAQLQQKQYTHVAMVHCETTTGLLNPLEEIGSLVNKKGAVFIVDAMSSFGAIPIRFDEAHIDFLVSSSNKCIEGLPGFSFVIGNIEILEHSDKIKRTLSLNLHDQWQVLERNGQFRFTPPVQTMLAFHQALRELEAEGGPEGRGRRYRQNFNILLEGMRNLGFKLFLEEKHQSYIITTFVQPDHPNFDFEEFYQRLSKAGFVIYPGKLTNANTFRIGTIGQLYPDDVRELLKAIETTLETMQINL
jgi:2-aminoethylphosphonate-pyruvate transaminase